MTDRKIVLKYIGHGSLIGVPARDLTQADLDNMEWMNWKAGNLVETGLYELVQKQEVKPVYRKHVKDEVNHD